MRGLIDADMLAHEVGHLKDNNGNLITWAKARKMVKGVFQALMLRAECGTYEAYVSGGHNFRHDVATLLPYKGHRAGADRGWADKIKDYLHEEFNAIKCLEHEADDAIAMRQWAHWAKLMEKNDGDEVEVANQMQTVIVSRDKDLLNVPGWHFRWSIGDKPDMPPFYQTFVQAIRHFYKQLLVGDTADNIKGLYNIGEGSAWVKQLQDMHEEQDMAAHVYDKYEKYYGQYADKLFKENGTLLHMWRRPNDEWLPPWERDEDEYYNI